MKKFFWDDYYNSLTIKSIILIALGFTITIGLVCNWLLNIQCIQSYSAYNPQYTFITGCRIYYHDNITPVDMVKNINI